MAKKTAEQIMETKVDTEAAADAIVNAADAVVKSEAPIKAPAVPNVAANVNKLVEEVNKRGGVKMKIVAGTEEVRNVNQQDKSINTGGPANHSNQVKLKVDSVKMNLGV